MSGSELAELLTALEQRATEPTPCALVRRAQEELDEETQEIVLRLAASETVSINQLHRTLKKSGFVTGRTTIGNHRRKDCTCYEMGAE